MADGEIGGGAVLQVLTRVKLKSKRRSTVFHGQYNI